jgi:hypothetical protein
MREVKEVQAFIQVFGASKIALHSLTFLHRRMRILGSTPAVVAITYGPLPQTGLHALHP